MGSRRSYALAAAVVTVAVAAAVGLSPPVEPREDVTPSRAELQVAAAAVALPPEAGSLAVAAPQWDEETLASLSRIGERALEQTRRPSLESVFERCEGRPQDLLVALEGHMRTYPEDAQALVQRVGEERDPRRLFVMSRALGRALEDSAARASTLDVLRRLDPQRRAVALASLVGRSEPEVTAFLLDVLEADPSDAARARAGALLSYAWDSLRPSDSQRALWIARATLGEVAPSEERVSAAADLLGRPEISSEDLALLQAALKKADSPGALSALAYGFAAATSDPQALRSALQSRRLDPSCPADLQQTLDSLLAALP